MSADYPNSTFPPLSDDGEPQVIIKRSATHPVFGQVGGSLLVIGLTLLLTVLAFAWKGYPFSQFATLPIGDRYDTLGNAADIEQAMKNLITPPFDLSRFNIYYPNPHPFAYTIAPYGIAVPLLPIYLLSGHNIALSVNLYFLATFALTAWGIYLLVRYLFAAPLAVAVLAGLMMAFAQYRFVHIPHVETLSMQFLIFGLYCLHRFLDRQRLIWGLALGLCFWLTLFSSGYLGYMFIFAGIIITILTLIWRHRSLTVWLLVYGAVVAVIVGIAAYPFLAMRLSATDIGGGGYDLNVINSFSATAAEWFYGSSLFYRLFTPFVAERTLLIGFVPAALTLLAWRYRKQPRSEAAPSPLKPWQIIAMYSLMIVVSYVLTLGPNLSRLPDLPLPSPYRLLLALPGFSAIRVPARFIVMAVIGTTVVSAFALTTLARHLRPGRFRLVFAVCAVLLVVELLPYSALLYPDNGLFRINTALPDVPVKAYQWLDAQATPAALHYPIGVDYDNIYAYETQDFHSAMVNGTSSFYPVAYGLTQWDTFPATETLDLLERFKVPYVLIHRRFLTDDRLTNLRAALEQVILSGRMAYVSTLDDVAIYQLVYTPPSRVHLDFNLPVSGEGWNAPEKDPDYNFTWSNSAAATLDIPAPASTDSDLVVQFRIGGAMPGVLDQMMLKVNDQAIALTPTPSGLGFIYSGVIPQRLLGADGQTLHLAFQTGEPVAPADIDSTSTDHRWLGAQFDWLNLAPQTTLASVDLSAPIDGQGWDNAEKTPDGSDFHWMTAAAATLNLPAMPVDDLGLIFRIDQWMSPDILDSLTVRANGQPVTLTRLAGSAPPTFRAVIPRGAVAIKPDAVQLTLIVNRTMTPHDNNPASQDFRQLALALSGVWTYPLHAIRLPIGGLPVDGGWTAPISAASETEFRWMSDRQAQISLPLPTGQPLSLTLDQVQTPDAETARSFTLAVNQIPVPLTTTDVKGRTVLKGTIPVEALAASPNGIAMLTFAVDQTQALTGASDGSEQARYGPAFGLLQIEGGARQPNAFQINLGATFAGSGWYNLETAPDQTPFRWMKATTSTVEFRPPGPRPLVLEAQVESAITPEIERSLTLEVNGQALALAPMSGDSHRYQAIIPASIIQLSPAATTLAFSVEKLATPQSLGQGDDRRALGVAFSSLTLYPADDVILDFDKNLNGTGWYGAEDDNLSAFQWMSATRATAALPFQPSGSDEAVVFKVAHSLSPAILSSLKLAINGDPVELTHDALQLDGSLWWGVVPASTLAKSAASGSLEVTFTVDQTASPQALGLGDDTRELGVALRWLMVVPPTSAPANIPASSGLAG